jgi:hypothetical protein
MKQGEVYPSPRSWKRVSDVLNQSPKLESNLVLLQNIMLGIVGERSVSAFGKFIREAMKGIDVSKMLQFWNKKFEEQIKSMQTQDLIHINREICSFFRKEEKLTSQRLTLESKKEVLSMLENKSRREAQKTLIELSPNQVELKESEKVISKECNLRLKFPQFITKL